ncbi:MAG: NAD(P)H-binding protein [Phycisphaeraceae bacterium]
MAGQSLCVALTGATGFVGRHILAKLLEAGHTVRALVRDRSKLATKDARVAAVQGDLFDAAALAELVKGADAVIHTVGIIMEKRRQGQTFRRVHVEGTGHLLDAARAAGRVRKWVQMSALGTRPDAVSTYHRTKWEAEELVHSSGFDYTIFRPSIIHGPDGEFMQMVKSFWCKWFPPFVPYFGGGAMGKKGAGRLQPVHVDDVARCCVEALLNPKASHETYPMGGPQVYTWPELYRAVGPHLPEARKKKIVAVPVWFARILAGKPGVPFNMDQVIMSQEDSTCETFKVRGDFGIELKAFEPMVKDYAGSIK